MLFLDAVVLLTLHTVKYTPISQQKETEIMKSKIDWNGWQCLKNVRWYWCFGGKKWLQECWPGEVMDRAAMRAVSCWISHSSHVRGDHYSCAPCFLGAWLTTLICRNTRHLKLAASGILVLEQAVSFWWKSFFFSSVGKRWLATAEVFTECVSPLKLLLCDF